jgi:hypothetical protein
MVEQKVVQFAEQLGRMIGTVRAKADGLLDRQALDTEITAIRDAASRLLEQVKGSGGAVTRAKSAAPVSTTRRSRGAVDAPGKRHRKPAPSTRGAKHSDTRIAKVKLSKEGRQPRRG